MIFDRYIFKDLCIAGVFIALTLAIIILLTESLRFLELVINAGASGGAFWVLTMLAMPRFFEIILPIAAMASTLFVYNRMTMDSELIVMRATGSSPLRLARPAILMSALAALILFLITTWITPWSLSHMENLRAEIKAQYSTLLFGEGVFNPIGDGLIVYIRERTPDGELHGIMIHDARQPKTPPVTIVARRGTLVTAGTGQQVLVYDGSRQSINPSTGALNQLDFDRYRIDLPDNAGPVPQRWREPEERTLMELLHPEPGEAIDPAIRRDFLVEFNRRLISPFLAPAFTLIALVLLLVGPVDRRGQSWRIMTAIACAIVIEGLYLSLFNLAHRSDAGLAGMIALVAVPIAAPLFFLHECSEALRQRWFFAHRPKEKAAP